MPEEKKIQYETPTIEELDTKLLFAIGEEGDPTPLTPPEDEYDPWG